MKATLEFNLDELDDRQAHLRCTKSLDMASALSDISRLWKKMERFYENTEGNEDDKFAVLNRYKDEIFEVLDNHNLNLDELIS